jgi:class 3 adenylate cyclase/tetratricopeptide (TPR) repeat protein
MVVDGSRTARAVMFTDVVGFTGIMERNEPEAMEILVGIRSRLLPLLGRHDGELVKEMGDSTLSLFPSPACAVRCARGLQSGLARESYRVRVGIHWGEVLLEEEDVFGDTVNIASRLEGISCPGGICLSGEVMRNYGPGRRPEARPLGLRKLKGLGRLVDVFELGGSRVSGTTVGSDRHGFPEAPREDRSGIPSLAVAPFLNMGDASEDFYAWGITSDLVSDLSAAGAVRVVPLTDVVALLDKGVERKLLCRELGVRYLATGTLWRRDESFHLSIELLDGEEGRLVWSDSWEDHWRELPALKGKLADGLLKVIGIQPYRYAWITGQTGSGAEAYELYLRGKHLYEHRKSHAEALSAREIFQRSIALDPDLTVTRIMLAATYRDEGENSMARLILERAVERAETCGDRAGRLQALNGIGIIQMQTSEPAAARATYGKVLRLSRALGDRLTEASVLNNTGLLHWSSGEYEKALEVFRRALEAARVLESRSLESRILFNTGLVLWSQGDCDGALDWYNQAMVLLEKIEDREGQANVLRNIGSVRMRRGELDLALEMVTVSLRISTELGDRPGRCKSLINMGNILYSCGRYGEADELNAEALGICLETGDRFRECIIRLNRGLLLLDSGKVGEAGETFLAALEMSRSLEDREGEALALANLGRVHATSGQYTEAVAPLREALEIMNAIGSAEGRPLVLLLLAGALLESGGSNIPEVLRLAWEAEATLDSDAMNRATALLRLAEISRRLTEMELSEGTRGRLSGYGDLILLGVADLESRAVRITDGKLRESFLHDVPVHRRLLEAAEALRAGVAITDEGGTG